MSEVKVNKISPRTNCGTVQLGDSGDTITIPAGATITNNGTQTGFGRTGTVNWDTTAKTASFTAVSGNGYFVNTTSSAITLTLPATPSAGDIVAVKDYAKTFDTNNVTLARNGSNIGGEAKDAALAIEGIAVTLVYVDATQGWLVTDSGLQSDSPTAQYITATGGTITCCGDYKIHTFTGPGTFTVSCAGNVQGSNTVSYIVVAGGGSGGSANGGGGGGGAGGFREGYNPGSYTASPLATSSLPVIAQGYTITVGGGGAGVPAGSGSNGNSGSDSSFSSITSAGGGFGATCQTSGGSGGSGGGAGKFNATGGAGNTPPVSPSQGNIGGSLLAGTGNEGGGGGGAGDQGETIPTENTRGGSGGIGVTSSISGTATGYAGGGGGNSETGIQSGGTGGFHSTGATPSPLPSPSPGTPGFGGGNGSSGDGPGQVVQSGTTNTGGGGGGVDWPASPITSGSGGSGIVIIRYKFQN
jgi:hypothetical protein